MIPLTIAEEIRTTILDYLATTFNFQDEEVEKALHDFLMPPQRSESQIDGLFKGPYISLRLPFRKADAGAAIPLEIRPNFLPYAHQLRSFERLSARDGHQPKPTLITTGTGSGKTECFLFPVLDYCYAHRGEAGIKAIILYPMNALATDQSARLARMIAGDPRLKGQVTAGIYIGGEGEQLHGGMGENNLIDDRDVLRKNPPDILLTNYKMLDFLLLRPEDKTLWAENTTETLRFLVLDELHTYDGAQGSDVACLIRRLKARLQIPEGFLCPIGTSATVASEQGDTRSLLTGYAEQIFAEKFELDSVIVEDRLSLDEFIPDMPTRDSLPAEIESLKENDGESYDDYINRQTVAWFGAPLTEPELAEALRSHVFLRAVLAQISASILPLNDLIEKLEKWDPTFSKFTRPQQSLLIQSFLALVAHARIQEGKDLRPFLTCQVQLWVREISRLMRELNAEPNFFWRDDVPLSSERRGLPAYFCRECGHSGWLTFMRDGDDYLADDHRKIYNEYFAHSRHMRYVYPAAKNGEADSDGFRVCGSCLTVSSDETCKACNKQTVAVHIYYDLSTPKSPKEQPNDMQRCPVCGTDSSLSIVGSQAASLSSVAISHLYTSPLNQDKKLLAFTDSVQDASHRASFFEARTYRFNLRTALQTALPADAPIRLDQLTDRVLSHWTNAWKGNKHLNQRVVATFMPPDLRELQNYKQYMDLTEKSEQEINAAPIPSELEHDLKQRLSWEITMEYGFTARVGRSLEKVGSSVAYLDPALLTEIAEILALRLPEEIGTVENISTDSVRHFLQGLLERTRIRGGIVHPLLSHYSQAQGNWYLLTKKQQILMSPFHKNSPRFPRFLTDTADGKVFDLFVTAGNRRTWYIDWCQKTFGDKIQIPEINELYRLVISLLSEKGLLKKYARANDHSYGIEPRHVWITPHAVILKCDQCGNLHTVPASEKTEWLHHPCMTFRCSGHYALEVSSTKQHYYREVYRRGQVERIFAHEHTGLLSRSTREKVEKEFKTQTRADATNLLTATPTLELGIDIGDLSSTMACSVPPAPANYLQRIGRAGRKTGNSLILTLANAQPHDLYFFEEPLEMMAGVITPPGCYLDAPDMLKRQYLAYCMDTWTATHQKVTLLPHDVSKMLAGIKKGGFPENLIAFIEENRQTLIDGFMEIFGPQISAENQERLLTYFASDEMFTTIRAAISDTETEREELRSARKALKTRRDKIEADPAQFKTPEIEIKRIQQDMHLLLDMIKGIEDQYILNFFTDAGLLPNYAFPETGVKFEAVITGFDRKGDNAKNYEVKKYVRAAAVAIRELAPSNHFYAEGHKLTISHIDVAGREKSIEKWQFCDNCSHMELVQASHYTATCPVCGSSMWADQGQQHDMVRFSKAMSYVDLHDSKVGDEGENRERAQFKTNHYFEMPPENSGEAIILPALPFGFEYHDQVTLREINFAPKSLVGQNFSIAGDEQPLQGFKTCRDCGVTVETSRINDTGQEGPKHTRNCASATTAQQIEWENIYLYRQVISEAIRILLPVSTTLVEEKMATFEACLDLALRKKFKGNPDHLHILPHNEPTADGNRRRFLVIYDSVQGGTGFLKELAKPEVFFEMLQLALDSLTSCRCRLNPEKQACYRCLYSYRVKHDLKLISRKLGAEMLSEILAQKDSRGSVASLSQIHIDSLIESELEQRFVYALGNFVKGKSNHKFSPTMYNGKQAWDLRLGETNWILEPQVHLGHAQSVRFASRADFVFWPRNTQSKPIAVFTDGFSYHVKPGNSLGGVADDIKKRRAIIDSRKFLVWSITWDDVKAFEDKKEVDWHFFTPSQITFVEQNLPAFRVRPEGSVLKQNAVAQLIQYLHDPSDDMWAQVAAFTVLSTLRPPRPPLDEAILQSKMDDLCKSENDVDMSMPTASSPSGNLYSVVQKGFTKLFSFIKPESIQNKRIDEFTVALRVNDFDIARNQPEFKEDWNRFWLLTNLLQFLPGFVPISTEYIRATVDEPAPVSTPVISVGEEWAQALRFASPEISRLLLDCQTANLPAPVIGYELLDHTDKITALAEAAWEDKKIAILLSDIEENKPAFESLGWTTFASSDTSSALIALYQTR